MIPILLLLMLGLFMLLTAIFCSLSLQTQNNGNRTYHIDYTKNYIYLFFVLALLTFFSGCRGDFQIDYNNYVWLFETADDYSFKTLFLSVITFQRRGVEPAFLIIVKLFRCITKNNVFLFCFIAGLMNYYILRMIKNNSKCIWLSIYLYICSGYFYGSFNLMRIALIGAFSFNAYELLKRGKVVKYELSILFFSLFHVTVLVMLFFPWLSKIKWTKSKVSLGLLFSIILMLSSYFLTDFVVRVGRLLYPSYTDDAYGMQSGLPITSLARALLVLIFIYMNYKVINYSDKTTLACFNASLLFIVVSMMGISTEIVSRLTYYYLPYLWILVPNVIMSKRNPSYNKLGIVIIMLFYFLFSSSGTYYFFWQ